MAQDLRQRVLRTDGKQIYLIPKRCHMLVCAKGCCCGHTERGIPEVPVDFYKSQYKRRKLRKHVQLTMSGCLGPCAMTNVVLLVFDGRPIWFQSINSKEQILALWDYTEQMLEAGQYLPAPPELEDYVFEYYGWSDSTGPMKAVAGAETGSESADAPDLLLLTHADTDLLCLHHAAQRLPAAFGRAEARSLSKITSEKQMDSLLSTALGQARLVVLRVLGGMNSVPGFNRLREHIQNTGGRLIAVSGTGQPDPELTAASNVDPDTVHQTTAYLQTGGQTNFENLLRYLSDHLLLTGLGYDPPAEQPEHGLYHPDLPEQATLEDFLAHRDPDKPTVGLLFYRAHWMSGNTAFIDALVRQIERRGGNALPVYTLSLKAQTETPPAGTDHWPAAFEWFCRDGQPLVDCLLTTMSFAMGQVNREGPTEAGWSVDALNALDVPVLQAIASTMTRWQWRVSERGLNPLDTAMNVAMPEFDGRLITAPVSFKEKRRQTAQADEKAADGEEKAQAPSAESAARGEDTCGEACETAGIAAPEFDVVQYEPMPDRVERVAGQALRHAVLRQKARSQKRIAFVLTNSPGKAARIGNAVGLDAPASLIHILRRMQEAGYHVENVPETGDQLIHELIDRCSYDEIYLTEQQLAQAAGQVSSAAYQQWFNALPASQRQQISGRWGDPPGEAYIHNDSIALPGLALGNVFIALQPPRGYGMDPDAIYHQPDLPPPHYFYAMYEWLRSEWGADAIVHVGKHGTVEWLPGKGVGVSQDCFPDTFQGDLPLFYPFILNNPGEGAQAKRRTHAAILDHLVPPMTRADVYDELAELTQLVDEYYQLELTDPDKLPILQQQIWELIKRAQLDEDLQYIMQQDHGDHTHEWEEGETPEGTPMTIANMQGADLAHMIEDLDAYLCELGSAQIRDGLHVLGQPPEGEQMVGLVQALVRVPNLEVPSLREAVAARFSLDVDELLEQGGQRFDVSPGDLAELADRAIVTHSDAVEAIDEICHHLVSLLQAQSYAPGAIGRVMAETFRDQATTGEDRSDDQLHEVLDFICRRLMPTLQQTSDEITNLVNGLDGRYIPAGPAGAPTRGMAHVLPTGRNFYAVDPRSLPSAAAWRIGQNLAREVIERYQRDTGQTPETVAINVWGTSAMRTHGDDIAEVMALLGVRPTWQKESRRMTGIEVIPLEELGRPRVDVVLRISGFFRDAFPHLIRMLDDAIERVTQLDEPPEWNCLRKHYLEDFESVLDETDCEVTADRRARYRMFGSRPGTYGAGILPLIEQQNWQHSGDLAEAYVNWGGYAYTADEDGVDARDTFRHRLSGVEIALHNQDNREHDIFDSDDYLQFHGGMIATIRALTGRKPQHYFGDTHDPAKPRVRDLKEEALRVFRSRVANPKWLEAMKRHGYKGGLEMNATVDYIFGFDATAGIASDWMYEDLAQKYALDPDMQQFLQESNPWALNAIGERLLEAAQRGLWNEPDPETLEKLKQTMRQTETTLESRGETPISGRSSS